MCNGSNYISVQKEELFSLWTKFVGFDAQKFNISRKNNTVFQCDITAMNGEVHKDVSVQLAAFSPQVFEHIQCFLVCSGCGKVYWEGSHLSRMKKNISKYINIKNENKTVYNVLLGDINSEDDLTTISPKT